MSKVTIVTPCYNGGRYVADMLRSVSAQTFENWEHIIVDDGSTDDSAAIVEAAVRREPRLRLIRQANAGVGRARNAGFAAAGTSDYVLFLDADDLLEPSMLTQMVACLDSDATTGLVHCSATLIDDTGHPLHDQEWLPRFAPNGGWWVRALPASEPTTPWTSIYAFAWIVPSLSLIRRSVYEQCSGWDESFGQPCEDTDLFLRVGLKSRVTFLSERLVRRRVHVDQSVADRDHLARQKAKLYAKWHMLSTTGEVPSDVVDNAERFVLRLYFKQAMDEVGRALRAGQPLRASRFLGGALRRYAWPLTQRQLGAGAARPPEV